LNRERRRNKTLGYQLSNKILQRIKGEGLRRKFLEVLGILCKAWAKHRIALVCTSEANVTSKGVIPRPIGGRFLKHVANVIVHLKEHQ
jgi:hypothetical protein